MYGKKAQDGRSRDRQDQLHRLQYFDIPTICDAAVEVVYDRNDDDLRLDGGSDVGVSFSFIDEKHALSVIPMPRSQDNGGARRRIGVAEIACALFFVNSAQHESSRTSTEQGKKARNGSEQGSETFHALWNHFFAL